MPALKVKVSNWKDIIDSINDNRQEILDGGMELDGKVEEILTTKARAVKGQAIVQGGDFSTPAGIIDVVDGLIAAEKKARNATPKETNVVSDFVMSADGKTITGTDSRGEEVTLTVASTPNPPAKELVMFTKLSFEQGQRRKDDGTFENGAYNLHGFAVKMGENGIGNETPVHAIIGDRITLMEQNGVMVPSPYGEALIKTIEKHTHLSMEVEIRKAGKTTYERVLADGSSATVYHHRDARINQELSIKKAPTSYGNTVKRYKSQLDAIASDAVVIQKEAALSRIRINENREMKSDEGAISIETVQKTIRSIQNWKNSLEEGDPMIQTLEDRIETEMNKLTPSTHQLNAAPPANAAPETTNP